MFQTKLYYDYVWIQKLRQENIPKISVEGIKGSGRSYPDLHLIGDLVQRSFHRNFHVCTDQGRFLKSFLIQGSFNEGFHVRIDQGSFLRSFLINSELWVNQ